MKQKIVIRVSMNDCKCRCKAMKIAVSIPGVESAALTGEDKNQVEVVGVGIDSVALTRRLRKNFACAELVSVGEVKKVEPAHKPKPDPAPKPKPDPAPAPAPAPAPPKVEVVLAPPYYCFPHYHYCEMGEPTTCTIL